MVERTPRGSTHCDVGDEPGHAPKGDALLQGDAPVERNLHSILVSRLKNAKRHGNVAHLPDLVQRDADRQERDEQNAHGVIVILVHDPQGDAEALEHVEGVQDLKDQRGSMVRGERRKRG